MTRNNFLEMAALPMLVALTGLAQKPWDLQRFAKTTFFFNSPTELLKRLPVPGRTTELGRDGLLWSAASFVVHVLVAFPRRHVC